MQIPASIYAAVEPIAQTYDVPTPLWANLAYYESNFNPTWIGDGPQYGGYSYGLFQVHVADGATFATTNVQGNNALRTLTGHDRPWSAAERALLLNASTNARFAIPPIAQAWRQYGSTFSNTYEWWIQFLAASGHPGGGSYDPITRDYTNRFMGMYNKNLFGQLSPASVSGPFPPIGSIGTPLPGEASPGAISQTAAKTYTPLTEQVHETLINSPGFYGIALTLDEAEQFPGWIDLSQPYTVDVLGAKVQLPDVTGTVRSAGASIADNFTPAAIRGGLILFGSLLFFMLMAKMVSGPVMQALPYLLEFAA